MPRAGNGDNLPPSMEDLTPPSMEDLRPASGARCTPSVEDLSRQSRGTPMAVGYAELEAPSVQDIRQLFNRRKKNVENQPATQSSVPLGSQEIRAASDIDNILKMIVGIQTEMQRQKQECAWQLEHLRQELHSGVASLRGELFSEMEAVKNAALLSVQDVMQDNLKGITNRICDVQSSLAGGSTSLVPASDMARTKEIENGLNQLKGKFETFDARLSNMEKSISNALWKEPNGLSNPASASKELTLDHMQSQASRSWVQPLQALPGKDQSAHDAFLQQLRRDAQLIPESILDPNELTPRRRGQSFSMDRPLALQSFQTGVSQPQMETKWDAVCPLPPTSTVRSQNQPNALEASSATSATDAMRLPVRSLSPRPESPRQVWSSDLPPSPRRSPRGDSLTNTI